MTFEELPVNRLKEEDYLWRYLDFHKFLYLFLEKKLFFSRLDLFQDPFEGVTAKLIKQRYLAKLLPDSNHIDPLLPNESKVRLLRYKESIDKKYQIESEIRQKTQYVNCWFNETRESMAMWNVYSNSDSVAIKIGGRNFVDYLKRIIELQPRKFSRNIFICGSVKYFEINPINVTSTFEGVTYSAFKKDKAYAFENEYRFLIVTPVANSATNSTFLSIDLTKSFFEMIEVICHPQIQEWKFENIKKMCEGFGITKIKKSAIEIR